MDFKMKDRRNTDCVKWDLAREDEIPLWVADMDFEVPEAVKDALIKRVEHGIFGYTFESDRYYFSVIEYFKAYHDLSIHKDLIVTTPGVIAAIKIAIQAFTKADESIIILEPCYHPFKKCITQAGRNVAMSQLILKENEYFVDFADFEAKIKANRVKMFILSNPHNPVMKVYSREELQKLGDICYKYGVILLSDEIHCDFTFNQAKHVPIFNVDQKFCEIAVIMSAPSKTFNLAGLQGSNIFFQNPKLKEKFQETRDLLGNSGLNTMAIEATIAAYNEGYEWLEAVKEIIKSNFDYLDSYLKSEIPQIRLMKHEATYLAWLDCRELNLKKYELEKLIRNDSKVWGNQGYIFGEGGSGFLRLNLACHQETLKSALARIKENIDKQKEA